MEGLFALGQAMEEQRSRQLIAIAWELYEGSWKMANTGALIPALYPEAQQAIDEARATATAALVAIGYNCHKLGIFPLIGPGGFGEETPTVH